MWLTLTLQVKDRNLSISNLLCHWYWTATPSTSAEILWSFSAMGQGTPYFLFNIQYTLQFIMWNHQTTLQHQIQKPQECFPNLWMTQGVVCILITRCWTLSLLQVESGTAVSIHRYLVFQWWRGKLELVRNFVSLAATKEVLMPGDRTGHDRISPMTLYGVFLKNKVNKTWDAEPRILIICLGLWGVGGGLM